MDFWVQNDRKGRCYCIIMNTVENPEISTKKWVAPSVKSEEVAGIEGKGDHLSEWSSPKVSLKDLVFFSANTTPPSSRHIHYRSKESSALQNKSSQHLLLIKWCPVLYSQKGTDKKEIPQYVTRGNSAVRDSTSPVGRSACRVLVNSTEICYERCNMR